MVSESASCYSSYSSCSVTVAAFCGELPLSHVFSLEPRASSSLQPFSFQGLIYASLLPSSSWPSVPIFCASLPLLASSSALPLDDAWQLQSSCDGPMQPNAFSWQGHGALQQRFSSPWPRQRASRLQLSSWRRQRDASSLVRPSWQRQPFAWRLQQPFSPQLSFWPWPRQPSSWRVLRLDCGQLRLSSGLQGPSFLQR